jgi:hypothetical protein
MRTRLVAYIGTRVSNETRSLFYKKAKKVENMDAAEVLRTLVVAFTEDRITITPPETKGTLK